MNSSKRSANNQFGHFGSQQNGLPIHIILNVGGFLFYLFELYSFFTQPQYLSTQDFSLELYPLKLITLIIILPLCYLIEIAAFFDRGDAMAYAIAALLKVDNVNIYAQIKIFEYTVYFLLSLFLIGRLVRILT